MEFITLPARYTRISTIPLKTIIIKFSSLIKFPQTSTRNNPNKKQTKHQNIISEN